MHRSLSNGLLRMLAAAFEGGSFGPFSSNDDFNF